jgi:protocatechuate 3,4-dioxygenase beta subunit
MDIDQDDLPVGRILTRREVLMLFGAAGTASLLAACAPSAGSLAASSSPSASAGSTASASSAASSSAAASASAAAALPSCIVRPAETEGPYFVDEKLNRSDIRSDPGDGALSAGLSLQLAFSVARISGSACTAFAGALVDVWHCDALGVYSDVSDPGFQTKGKKFLRGYQLTDANGVARFTTIYPGWYQGRTVHIHFKIRSDAGAASGLEFTSQLFFDDAVTDQVHATAPYAQKGQRTLRNDGDGIFANGGSQLLVQLAGDARAGYSTTFDVGLQVA